MIYTVFFKDGKTSKQYNIKDDMELARNILKQKFFENLDLKDGAGDDNSSYYLDATETDDAKTGIIMSFQIQTSSKKVEGSVYAIKENDFFITDYQSNIVLPKKFAVNFI